MGLKRRSQSKLPVGYAKFTAEALAWIKKMYPNEPLPDYNIAKHFVNSQSVTCSCNCHAEAFKCEF